MRDGDIERNARRLVRLYPRPWRRRFGDEFEQLLIDEIRDRRHSPRRVADVVAHALLAHLTAAGLAGRRPTQRMQAWQAMRALGGVAVLFLAIGTGMWSQMTVGWTWASPTSQDTRIAMGLMSGALLGLCAIFALAVLLVLVASVRRGRGQLASLLVTATCGAALGIGCGHFAARWPGAGTSGWEARSIVPSALGRIGWAGTLWISAYWTHPGALIARPGGVVAWMVVSPLLLATATVAGLFAVRHASPSSRVLRALTGLGGAGVVLAALFVAGAAVWILAAGPGPRQMFQAGSVDDVGLGLLGCALLAAAQIAQRGLIVVRRIERR